jgi:hypothetical protein
MTRFFRASLFALGFAATIIAGCGGPPMSPEEMGSDLSNAELAKTAQIATPPPGCYIYNPFTSALAEFTIDCTGTVAPESFLADDKGYLRRGFQACNPRLSTKDDRRNPIGDVDGLLSLQQPEPEKYLVTNPDGSPVMLKDATGKEFPAPLYHVCLSTQWNAGVAKLLASARQPACPTWTKIGATGIPTRDAIANFSKNLPMLGVQADATTTVGVLPKEEFYYAVRSTAAADACTAGLPGFFVRPVDPKDRDQDTQYFFAPYQGYAGPAVLGDPLWWLDPTYYAPGTDPYMVADYYHPMSLYRDLPGARFGHRNRACEACSYWNGAYHMIGQLRRYCMVAADYPDGPSCNMTHCEDTSTAPTCPIPSGP